MTTLYLILAILVLIGAILFLRLRIRFAVEGLSKRILFIGIGRSGILIDFAESRVELRIADRLLKRLRQSGTVAEKDKDEAKIVKAKKSSNRKRSWADAIFATPATLKALLVFAGKLIMGTRLEEAEGSIRAGFDQPDLTGITYGYYQAALAASPSIVGRLQYEPDWTGASFDGSAKISLAVPMYKLTWISMVLLKDLPLRKLYKLAIGQKRGGRDG